jgi:hypothetical protein
MKQHIRYCKNCESRLKTDHGLTCSLTSKPTDFLNTCPHFVLDFNKALKNDLESLKGKYNDTNGKPIKKYWFWSSIDRKSLMNRKEIIISHYDKRIIYGIYFSAFLITLFVGIYECIALRVISNLTIGLIIMGSIGFLVFFRLMIRFKKNNFPELLINDKGINYREVYYSWSNINLLSYAESRGNILIIKEPTSKEVKINLDNFQYYPSRVLNYIYHMMNSKQL